MKSVSGDEVLNNLILPQMTYVLSLTTMLLAELVGVAANWMVFPPAMAEYPVSRFSPVCTTLSPPFVTVDRHK